MNIKTRYLVDYTVLIIRLTLVIASAAGMFLVYSSGLINQSACPPQGKTRSGLSTLKKINEGVETAPAM